MTKALISTFVATYLILIGVQVQAMDESSSSQPAYGVDCSFPIHSKTLICGSLLGDRQSVYEEFMAGCRLKYKEDCDSHEEIRMATALRQATTALNITMEGFKVIEAPAIVKEQLNEYWKNNKNRMKEERWPKGATAVNHWASPTYIVKAKENGLRGSGARLEEVVKEATKRSLEQWTHMEMKPAAVHGIRVHTEGAIIPPHVVGTKAPLMHSAIVNVAQSLDESWVLELYKRDGSAVNITLEPGSMLLFESSSLIYGHPFPLKGRYFASYHLDFYTGGRHPDELDDRDGEEHHASELSNAGVAETETIQWNYHKDTLHELDSPSINQDPDDKEGEEHHASELTNSSVAETETIQWNNHKDTLHELDSPSTNQDPDDKEGEEYHASELNNSSLAETETTRRNNPKDAPLELDSPSTNHHTLPAAMPGVETEPRPPEPLLAAAYGDVVLFAKLTMENKEALTVKDKNGWEPIHEAARWGQLQILEILIGSGVNVNQVSNFDRGDSPLRIAMDHLEEGHPVLAFLKLHGGI